MFLNLKFKKHFITIIILVMLIVSCSPASSSLPVTPTSYPTLAPVPSATETMLPAIPSSTSTPICPVINPDLMFIPPKSNDEISPKILAFLNSGGDLNQVNLYFAQFQLKTLDVIAADLNEDGLNEIIVAGALPLELKSPDQGVIYIFGCKENSYEIDKEFDFQNIASAEILRTEKLLAAYPQQAIIRYRHVSGWGSRVLAIGFMNGEWQVVFDDENLFPELVIFDQDKDGNKEISIHALTTATQGPQREMISTFKWDGKQYALISNQLMPGRTRVEYLDDAQKAFDQGDISMAIAYYDRAANDPSLNNSPSRDEIVNKQTGVAGDYQISFALFRLYTLWSSVHDSDNASFTIEELEEQFPVNMPGNEFSQAAKIFEQKNVQGKTPKEACSAVTSFLTQNYPNLNIHIGDWGMMVAAYTQIIELCPFH